MSFRRVSSNTTTLPHCVQVSTSPSPWIQLPNPSALGRLEQWRIYKGNNPFLRSWSFLVIHKGYKKMSQAYRNFSSPLAQGGPAQGEEGAEPWLQEEPSQRKSYHPTLQGFSKCSSPLANSWVIRGKGRHPNYSDSCPVSQSRWVLIHRCVPWVVEKTKSQHTERPNAFVITGDVPYFTTCIFKPYYLHTVKGKHFQCNHTQVPPYSQELK